MKILLILLLFITLSTFGSAPTISNFEINPANPNRVYFNSSEPITASNYIGFTISGKAIINIMINGSSLTGHYFTVSNAFNFWDNNTIRYEGGGDIENLGNESLIDFTLTYIVNNIPEPSANVNRYVNTSASGGGNGQSEATAWTLTEAFSNAVAGQTVWIKAGNYGNLNLTASTSGTATNPIKFIGYKNSIGDITSNYYDYGVTWNTSEMPSLAGSGSGEGIALDDVSYLLISNIQLTNYSIAIRASQSNTSHIIFNRVNTWDNNDGYDLENYNASLSNPAYALNNVRILNAVSGNNSSYNGIKLLGEGHNLIDNCKVYDDTESQDYAIQFNGHNNIVRNCYVEYFSTASNFYSFHGIGVRGTWNNSNTYNLIEKCNVKNIGEAFYVRNWGSNYNVIKDCNYTSNANGVNYVTTEGTGIIQIDGGCDYNIFERITGYEATWGIKLRDDGGENNHPDDDIGNNNIIRNCIFNRTKYAMRIYGNSTSELYNLKIINCTFNDGYYLLRNDAGVDVQSMEFINCNFTNFIAYPSVIVGSLTGISFLNSNFHNNRNNWVGSGASNLNVDPQFVNIGSGDFHLQSTSPLIDAGVFNSNTRYDIENKEREFGPFDIGAYEYGVATSCNTYIYDTISVTIDSSDNYMFNGQSLTAVGTYKDTIDNQPNCDAITTLYLNQHKVVKPCKLPTGIVPVVDGVEDIFWSNIPSVGLTEFRNGNTQSPFDLSATYKIAWDNTSLYILINVTDDVLVNDNGVNDYYYDDAVDIYIDGLNENNTSYDVNDFNLAFKYGEAYFIKDYILYSGTDINKAESLTGTGYMMEIKIDWSLVGITPTSNTFIGFDISVNDDDDGGARDAKIIWNDKTDMTYTNPSRMGLLIPSTADCYNTTSTTELTSNMFTVYPNPSTGEFTIDVGEYNKNYELNITNSLGQLVYTKSITTTQQTIMLKEKGVYFIRVTDVTGIVITKKVVVR